MSDDLSPTPEEVEFDASCATTPDSYYAEVAARERMRIALGVAYAKSQAALHPHLRDYSDLSATPGKFASPYAILTLRGD